LDSQKKTGFNVNVLTSESTRTGSVTGNETSEFEFVSRMFAPKVLVPAEDQVCGSAHCLSTPYWSRKKKIAAGKKINAAHVSQRGGALVVSWDEQEDVVKIRGVLQIFAKGTVFV
jgi:predicted PhzF superfamily epimerase YddE/YHI9